MREKFFTSRQIAEKLQVSDRRVRQLAEQEGWEFREVKKNGAKEKRFALSTLPLPVRTKLAPPSNAPAIKNSDIPCIGGPAARLALEPYNRAVADARLTALELFKNYHEASLLTKTEALHGFTGEWAELASPELLEIIPKISRPTLLRWQSEFAKGGLPALAPNFGKRKGITKLPEKYRNIVLQAYLDPNRRSARSIYTHIIHRVALDELGGKEDKALLIEIKNRLKKELSEYVVLNFIRQNTTKGMLAKARGSRAEREKVLPYLTRSRENLDSNEVWVSDGHDANTFVLDEYGGIVRPVVVVWMDERSRMITGWAVDVTENTDLIITSLCNAVEAHGVPKTLYMDNGKAYMNKRTSEKFQSENRLKAYAMLGCKVMNARPHNAREKSVERFWGTLDNNFSKYLPGYAGKDILSKPESTSKALKQRNILTIEEYRNALEKFILKYNTDSHSGIENKAPYEVWTRSLKEITHADPELLAQMRLEFIAELRTIMAGGRIRVRNREYTAPNLIVHVGERVEVALDPADLDTAYIFFEGKLLTKAEGVIASDFNDKNSVKTRESYKQLTKAQKDKRNMTKKIKEIQSRESAILLAEKAKLLENKEVLEIQSEEIIDIFDY